MSPSASGTAEGGLKIEVLEQFAQSRDQLLAAFPDRKLEILHSVGDEREACVHRQASGTRQGVPCA